MATATKKISDKLFPCEVNGNHEVKNIRLLNPHDFDDKLLLDYSEYVWTGICKHCGNRIVAKDLAEYSIE